MPLPVPNLDDRRFDDLVAEAKSRLATHLPELTQIVPGDPVHGIVDLFAWFTETILYRANLIPERQRRVFLNLLQIPVRPARAARGLVCVDATPTLPTLPPLLSDAAQMKAGPQTVTSIGELQPTVLGLRVAAKQVLAPAELHALGITLQDLAEQFGLRNGEVPTPFRPRQFELGKETLELTGSLDRAFYLAGVVPRALEAQLSAVRQQLAGITLNVGIAPPDMLDGDAVHELNPRTLIWELASLDEQGEVIYLPLELLSDSSLGARQVGVARLRLPKNAALFTGFAQADPMFAGVGGQPPELADPAENSRVALWLRLRCPEHDLQLGYLALNAVDVVAQGFKQNVLVGVGTGQADQVIALPDGDVDAATLQLDVEDNGAWVRWQRVDFLSGHAPDANVFQLDRLNGYVSFGDGISAGRRPPEKMRIRCAAYLYGGGANGNLQAGSVKEIVNGNPRYRARQDWPFSGGLDAESVPQAEKRIPQFLTHRNRAITRDDFKIITESNPVAKVARAEVKVGFFPGARIEAARKDVPGVVSVFVLPPATPALGQTPRPSQGLLKDVFGYLINRVLIGTELYVLSPEFVSVAVSVKVQVRDVETERQTLQEVQAALIDYLWPLAPGGARNTGWPLGGSVSANELITQVARVAGVLAVNGLALFVRNGVNWRRLPDNEVVALSEYQLPELVGVRADTGSGAPDLPDGLGPSGGAAGPRGVAVPVTPELC